MAGTVTASVVKNDTTSPPQFQNSAGTEIGQLCRAWVKFVGSTASINASFNVSSITRSASGRYQVNFTSSLPDTNYAPVVSSSSDGSSTFVGAPQLYSNGGYPVVAPTTSSFLFAIPNSAISVWVDPPAVSVAVFR